MNLRGTVIYIPTASGPGAIRGDDGPRYTFNEINWQDHTVEPRKDMRVGFTKRGSVATGVHHLVAEPPPRSIRSYIIFVLSQGAHTCLRPQILIRVGSVLAVAAIAIVVIISFLLFRDSSTAYAEAYSEQIDAGESGTFAREYAEEIIAGHSPRYAYAYSEQIEARESEEVARAYAEYIDAAFSYDSDGSRSEFRHFPLAGITPVPANYAAVRSESKAEPESTGSVNSSSEQAMNAVVVLAMYSTTLDAEASKRAVSVFETTTYIEQGDVDNTTLLGLLNDIAPEASIEERMEASRKLARISDDSDGEMTPEQSMQVANEMTRLITGHGIDAEQRTAAALEVVRLSQSGELNGENAVDLMDTIAPEWSIAERREALGYLAWQFSRGEWDADSTKRTAEEGYTLITGGEIQIERRMEGAVGLVGEGLKRYGDDRYDDESVNKATKYLQAAIRGDLNNATVSNLIGFDNADSKEEDPNNDEEDPDRKRRNYYNDALREGYSSHYADQYAGQRMAGKPYTYAHSYIKTLYWMLGYCPGRIRPPCDPYAYTVRPSPPTGRLVRANYGYAREYAGIVYSGASSKYAHFYAQDQIEDSLDDVPRAYLQTYAEQREAGKSNEYARAYAEVYHLSEMSFPYPRDPVHRHDRVMHSFNNISRSGYAHSFAYYWENTYLTFQASEYAKQIDAGKSRKYAQVYAHAIGKIFTGTTPRPPRDVNAAHAYAEQIVAGKPPEYAYRYAQGSFRFDSSQYPFAPDYRHAYSKAYAAQIEKGKPDKYAHAYTDHIIAGYSPEYSVNYAIRIEDGKSSRYAHAYSEYILAGYSERYAHAYSEQIDVYKPWVYARRYAEQIDSGRSPRYSHAYAWLVNPVAAVAAPSDLYDRIITLMD